MKILFISTGNKVDYQCDCLFHGLNSLDDTTVYTLNLYWYMYNGNYEAELLKQYGKGFTLCNRIPREKQNVHTKEEAISRIEEHFYDAVIYGSIFRCKDLLDVVIEKYSKKQIIFIDGEDTDYSMRFQKRIKGLLLQPLFFGKMREMAFDYATKGLFFKRELREKDRKHLKPIAFAIPEKNIVPITPLKEIDIAAIIPGDLSTYIYENENDYYNGYKIARFGITFKKGGWDCLRHYEILANGCIPYFPGLKKCPSTTMYNFPKQIILETNRLFEEKEFTSSLSIYEYYNLELLNYTKEYLTTTNLAKYILSFIE